VAAADSPTARIRAFMQSSADVFDLARDRWIAGSRAFREGGRGGQHLAAIVLRDRYESLLRQCIAEGIASGEVRAIDPAIAGRFLLSGLNQMTNWHRPDGRLGVTERHLRRVFAQAHGVSPIDYLTTQRLLQAKQLLTDTELPVTEVALACGFESLRRFNAVFAEVYKRTPSDIRHVRFKPV